MTKNNNKELIITRQPRNKTRLRQKPINGFILRRALESRSKLFARNCWHQKYMSKKKKTIFDWIDWQLDNNSLYILVDELPPAFQGQNSRSLRETQRGRKWGLTKVKRSNSSPRVFMSSMTRSIGVRAVEIFVKTWSKFSALRGSVYTQIRGEEHRTDIESRRWEGAQSQHYAH